jgi:hypothetical protein
MKTTAELDLTQHCRLQLYASLTNQNVEQAAQEILTDWLESIGEVRISHRISEFTDRVNEIATDSRKGTRQARKSASKFEQLINDEDRIRVRGMGITLD